MSRRKPNISAKLETLSAGLAKALTAARGDERAERAALEAAVSEYLALQGAPRDAHPAEFLCAEFFTEGDADNEPVFDQMELDDADRERLLALLTEVAGY